MMQIEIQDTLEDQLNQITPYTYCLLLPSARHMCGPFASFHVLQIYFSGDVTLKEHEIRSKRT